MGPAYQPSKATQAGDSTARDPSRKVVLVVDDEALVRMLAVDLFEEAGCEVIEAADGVEALERLQERPDISLLFTDCRMPRLSGPDLATAAASRRPDLQIVLVTGYHGLASCDWPVVWKPYDSREIGRILDASPAS